MPSLLKVTWTVEGVDILNRSFARMGENLSDLRPIWDSVQDEFWKVENENFKSENARGSSGTWKPLSRPYAKRKAQRYGVKTILRASDALYKSLTEKTGDTVLLKDKQEFGIGTSLEYARYHQRGGKKLPKRPVIDFSEAQKTQLAKGMQRDILKVMRNTGLDIK